VAIKPMDEKHRMRFQQGAAEFLEPDEQVEDGLWGLRFSFGAWVLNNLRLGTPNRWVLVTASNVYVFELGNREGVKGKTPIGVLAKHARGAVPVSMRLFPMKLSIGDQHVTPTITSAARIKPVSAAAEHAAGSAASATPV
jgi:hypothetical protein